MSAHVLEHRGCRLAYDVAGDGPPVLFIQGVGVHGHGWSPQVEGLSSRVRCLTFDNRGMGASQPLTGARFECIAGASHGVPIQCADRINALLLEHVTGAE